MTNRETRLNVQPHEAAPARAPWQRPEIRRMRAGDAEIGSVAAFDALNQTS
jgi:hypothetical protein